MTLEHGWPGTTIRAPDVTPPSRSKASELRLSPTSCVADPSPFAVGMWQAHPPGVRLSSGRIWVENETLTLGLESPSSHAPASSGPTSGLSAHEEMAMTATPVSPTSPRAPLIQDRGVMAYRP